MAHARVVLLEPEHPGERGHHRRAILRADAERLQAGELAPRDLDGIAVLHLVGVAQERGHRPMRLLAQRRARRAPEVTPSRRPAASRRAKNSAAGDFPRPGSPMRLSTWARPARMSSKAACIRAARSRPTRCGQPEALEAAGRARGGERAQQAMDPTGSLLPLSGISSRGANAKA